MGKSPGKWIKTVLFAKKSSRSHSSKGRDASKAVGKKEAAEGKGLAASAVNSPVISQPLPMNAARNHSTAQGRAPSLLTTDRAVPSSINQDATIIAPTELITPGKIREEKAAVKAQAAFRGYLARRAFRTLLGIIRLQALIRGHLVRRQAIATLHCLQGIVKAQALIRGRHVRLSGIGSAASKKLLQAKFLDTKQVSRHGANTSTQKGHVWLVASSNPFVCKLLSSKPVALPLQMRYDQDEPNSVWNWLERWTHSHFWKPLPRPKKIANLRSQTRNDGYAMETGSGRSKRMVRRNSPSNTNSETMNNMVKHNIKKATSSSAETCQEHSQNELEKVKRNLRKVSNSVGQMPVQAETEVEKSNHSARKVPNLATDVSEIEIVNSVEKIKKNGVLLASDANPEIQNHLDPTSLAHPQVETTSVLPAGTKLHAESTPTISSETKQNMDAGATEQLEADIPVSLPISDQFPSEQQPVHGSVKNKKHTSLNVQKPSNEEQTFKESQKISRRRVSLSAKTEFKEDGIHDTPSLPSYMAVTESAKAKLRGLSSPRISADGIEKSGVTRRHSLPSSTNGRLSTLSSQTQRQAQTNDRGGIRNDRFHGHDKAIQVEWRR